MDPGRHDRDPSSALVHLERAVAAGVVLGHDADGRVVLAREGLPGELVALEVERERPRMVQGRVVEVLEAAPGRVVPPCPLVAEGCGGCDLQHASLDAQSAMRLEVVRDALSHIGGVAGIPVAQHEPSPPVAQRTTMRMAVTGDRLGLRHRRSHEVVAVPECLVVDPGLAPVLARGHFPGAREVTVRASAATGEVVAVVSPTSEGASVPDGVRLVGSDQLDRGERVWLTEIVDGHRLRVSAASFFQSGPVAAAALGRAVSRALEGFDRRTGRFVDLYGGIGLFTVLLGAERAEVVERSRSAAADARVNTAELGAKVVRVGVENWRPSRADAVVADPSRKGLGVGGVAAVAATGADRVALVNCDPAALGRDVALFSEAGYSASGVEVVDMFPHTHHVEAVTALVRTSRGR